MIKKLLKLTPLLLICAWAYANAPTTVNPMNDQPLPSTQQLVNQCENNIGSPNCPQIVKQGEQRYQAQQASLNHPINQNPPPTAPIPKQPGPGSNPTEQPNY